MGIFARETRDEKEARKAFERWADEAIKGARKEYGRFRDGYWNAAEKRLKELLRDPRYLDQLILVRVYEHRDAKQAARMFEIEANVLAQRAFVPVSQSWSSVKPATSLLGGIGLLAAQTLTVSYERRSDGATSE